MLTAGERIGDYEILDLLGAGGMGAVYRARDTRLGRLVAIKTLLPGMSFKRELVQRFEQEWRSTASIKSEHIPVVYGVGSLPNGTLWMAMEYLDGATLGRVFAEFGGRMTAEQAFRYLAPTFDGVQEAHANGIVHRDLKPENIFVERKRNAAGDIVKETIKILDFGVARVKAADGMQTRSGVQLGTVPYMSPEALRGNRAEPTADVYSLGVIAYQLTTGRHPYQTEPTFEQFLASSGEGGIELYDRIRAQPVPDARVFNPDLPEAWARAIQALLARDARLRPQSATEAKQLLAAALPTGEQIVDRYARDPKSDAGAMPSGLRSSASHFVLGEKIGEGGMSEVFRGLLVGADGFSRPVAIKRVHSIHAKNPKTAKALQKEAQSLSRLQHPNIVSVVGFERTADNSLLLAMDLVEGCDVDRLCKVGRIPAEVIEVIAREVALALRHAHAKGIVHGDVSARNVLIGWTGSVRLTDFGLARATGEDPMSVTIKGTPRYLAPEIADGKGGDMRADLWSLGVVLWELAAGVPLFGGRTPAETIGQVMHHEIKAPHTVKGAGRIPSDFEKIVMRLLKRDREKRYATTGDVLRDLSNCKHLRALTDHEGTVARFLAARFPPSMRDANNLGTAPPDGQPTAVLAAVSTLGSTASQQMPRAPNPPRPRGSQWTLILGGLFAAVATGALVFTAVRIHKRASVSVEVASAPNTSPIASTPTSTPGANTSPPNTPTPPPSASTPVSSPNATAPNASVAASSRPNTPSAPPSTTTSGSNTKPAPSPEAVGATHHDHAAAPTAVRPTGTGSLFVSVDPSWADCYVDGRRISSTPCHATNLSAGSHQLRLVNAQMHVNETKTVVIVADQQTTIDENW